MQRKIITVLLGLSLGAFVFPQAMAQTPDGLTPANEGICDDLKADGITKGLYGLCIAFCEAQDHADILVPLTEADIEALANAAPSGKILDNYNKKKTETDPPMPCIVVDEPCPCWSQADLSEIDGVMWDGAASFSTDPFELNGRRCIDNAVNVTAYEIDRSDPFSIRYTQANSLRFGATGICLFRRFGNAPGGLSTSAFKIMTPDEYQACNESLRNFQANSGFCESIQQ